MKTPRRVASVVLGLVVGWTTRVAEMLGGALFATGGVATGGIVTGGIATGGIVTSALFVPGVVTARVAQAEPVAHPGTKGPAAEMRHRRPASLAFSGDRLIVANRASGSVSVVDVASRRVTNEVLISRRLSSLIALPSSTQASASCLLATDEATHELLVLSRSGEEVTVVGRQAMARYPVDVRVAVDGTWAAVTSLWSRRLTIVDVRWESGERSGPPSIAPRRVVDLPFAPRRLLVAPDQRHVLVADNFGGRLAIIDAKTGDTRSVTRIQGHHLNGLASSHEGKHVMLAHQILNGRATTEDDPVFWGVVLTNVLQSYEWDSLVRGDVVQTGEDETGERVARESGAGEIDAREPEIRTLARGDVLPLGEPSHGTGDPGAVWISSRGKAVVCLSGVDEVAVRSSATQPMLRLAVGRRPMALAADSDERWCVVANELDDSLSIIDLTTMKVAEPMSLGPRPALSAADRGERLFFDARLSLDGWFSCHSCHVDGHTNDMVNDNQGDDSFGAPKRVPSLLGVGETGPWAWNGSQKSLEGQILKSLHKTMRGDDAAATDEHARDLAEYLRTLPAAPSLAAARDEPLSESARRGEQAFQRAGCVECHAGARFTSPRTFDVGLRDELGGSRFNPPSLLGVSQRNAYFHDARARRLEQVLGAGDHPGVELSEQERRDLIEYLRRL